MCFNLSMARKKHRKSASLLRSEKGGAQTWDLFRADSVPPAPLWKWFWPLMAAGLALRVFSALSGDYAIRPDENFQILEQAHRLVWGYGLIPWEFGVGARNWLTVLPAALPLAACRLLGLEDPAQYAEVVEVYFAALSMSVPLGMFALARNYYGETAARAALIVGCFWHEPVLYAPHALPEMFFAYLWFAAAALVSPRPSRTRALAVGILLGLTALLRPHISFSALALAAIWVFALSSRGGAGQTLRFGVLGGAVAALLFLLADWIGWGEPGHSLRMYFAGYDVGMNKIFGNHDKRTHLANLTFFSGGACAVALLLLARWRRHGTIATLAIPTLAFHLMQSEHVYSYIHIVVMLLLLVVADEVARALSAPKWRLAGIAASFAALLISAAGLNGKFPQHYKAPNDERWNPDHRLFISHRSPRHAALNFLSRLPEGELGGVAVDSWWRGGYYRLHRKVPIYALDDSEHAALLRKHGWGAATHVVVSGAMPEMELIYEQGEIKVYKTGAEPSPPLPGHGVGVYNRQMIRSLLELGWLDAPPENPPLPR